MENGHGGRVQKQTVNFELLMKDISDKDFYELLKCYVMDERQRSLHGFVSAEETTANPNQSLQSSGEIRNVGKNTRKFNGKICRQERTCCRCRTKFQIIEGLDTFQGLCRYHWGKLNTTRSGVKEYSCCGGIGGSLGCEISGAHVQTGTPKIENFTRTTSGSTSDDGYGDVFAIDCEMCFTFDGLEVTKVCVVGRRGLVYETFVRPLKSIIDFNTRFSGITYDDIYINPGVKCITQVRACLLSLIKPKTILIGHGLENDLRALMIHHDNVVDTTFVYPHTNGLPYKRSLKSIVQECFGVNIHHTKHNCKEDAQACFNLMAHRVIMDFKLNQSKSADKVSGSRQIRSWNGFTSGSERNDSLFSGKSRTSASLGSEQYFPDNPVYFPPPQRLPVSVIPQVPHPATIQYVAVFDPTVPPPDTNSIYNPPTSTAHKYKILSRSLLL